MKNLILNPEYISGLTQADGSLFISVSVSSRHKNGLRIRPKFSITQDLGSVYVLEAIKEYFNCGQIYKSSSKHSAEYVVDSIKDLTTIIIPHYQMYPLHLDKQRALNILINVINTLENKEHYNKLVIANMLKLIFAMNTSSSRSLANKNKYFEILEVVNDNVIPELPKIIDIPLTESFLIGLIDGDGCFSVSFGMNRKLTLGFHITGHTTIKPLFIKAQSLLGVGQVRDKSSTEVRYQIDNFTDISNVLIPLIDRHVLHTTKSEHCNIFKSVVNSINTNVHQTKNGFISIVELAYNMNLEGKRRKLSKQEYINKYVINWK